MGRSSAVWCEFSEHDDLLRSFTVHLRRHLHPLYDHLVPQPRWHTHPLRRRWGYTPRNVSFWPLPCVLPLALLPIPACHYLLRRRRLPSPREEQWSRASAPAWPIRSTFAAAASICPLFLTAATFPRHHCPY